jgi:hypothetical protein
MPRYTSTTSRTRKLSHAQRRRRRIEAQKKAHEIAARADKRATRWATWRTP